MNEQVIHMFGWIVLWVCGFNLLLALIHDIRVRIMLYKREDIIYRNPSKAPESALVIVLNGMLTSASGQRFSLSKSFLVNYRYSLSKQVLWSFVYRLTKQMHSKTPLSDVNIRQGQQLLHSREYIEPFNGICPWLEQFHWTAITLFIPFVLLEYYQVQGVNYWLPYFFVFYVGFLFTGFINVVSRRFANAGTF